MEYLTKLILLLVLFICEVCEGSIRCYVCTTSSGINSDRCGDNFRLTATDAYRCEGTCLKTRGYRTEGSRRVIEVTRGCVQYREEGCTSGTHLGISADMCYCNEELCNVAPSAAQSFTTPVLVALVTSIYLLYNQQT